MADWSLLPYLSVADAAAAIDFYTRAFGARETYRVTTPDGGKIVHASMEMHGATLYLSDIMEQNGQGTGRITLHLEVPDSDAVFARAVEAGATPIMPVAEMFWGARYGKLTDPSGIVWALSTQVRQPSEAEMKAAIGEMCSGKSC